MQSAYDNWVTTQPEDGYSEFFERVYDLLDEDLILRMEENDFNGSNTEIQWIEKMFARLPVVDLNENGEWETFGDMTHEKAAAIIQRAYRMHFLNKN